MPRNTIVINHQQLKSGTTKFHLPKNKIPCKRTTMFPHVLKTTLGDVSASQSDSQSIGKIAKQQTHSFNKKRSQYTNQSNRHKQSLMNNQIKSIIDYSRMLAGKYQLNSHRQNE